MAQFANTTAVNLGSLAGMTPSRVISQSNISLDIVQPFLAGDGGGAGNPLELHGRSPKRNVVYAVKVRLRQKFRQEFYVRTSPSAAGGLHRWRHQAGVNNALTGGTLNAAQRLCAQCDPGHSGHPGHI